MPLRVSILLQISERKIFKFMKTVYKKQFIYVYKYQFFYTFNFLSFQKSEK